MLSCVAETSGINGITGSKQFSLEKKAHAGYRKITAHNDVRKNSICLTRPELGSPATFRWLGGGANIAPLPNFRTNRRSEEREAAIESSQREDSNAILKFS